MYSNQPNYPSSMQSMFYKPVLATLKEASPASSNELHDKGSNTVLSALNTCDSFQAVESSAIGTSTTVSVGRPHGAQSNTAPSGQPMELRSRKGETSRKHHAKKENRSLIIFVSLGGSKSPSSKEPFANIVP